MSLLILSELKRKITLKTTARLILAAAFASAAAGCGLPNLAYLSPPFEATSLEPGSDYIMSFRNAPDNGTGELRGYEFYYKLYDPSDTSSSAAKYSDDKKKCTADTADYNTLNNSGFHRLYMSGQKPGSQGFTHSSDYPVLTLPEDRRGESFKITLRFVQTDTGDDTFVCESELGTRHMYRWVKGAKIAASVEKAKSFGKGDFDYRDTDMPGWTSGGTSGTPSITPENLAERKELYISVYVLSYGKDPADITKNVYSKPPVYLGTISLSSDVTTNYWE